jgi:hypothetical protein
VQGDGIASDSVITNGLAGSVMHWASPVTADAKVGDDAHRVDLLLRSSADAWLGSGTNVEPNLSQYPDTGFPSGKEAPADKRGVQTLAVSVTGGFASAVAKTKQASDAKDADAGKDKDASRLIAHSPPDTRVVVFGSSAFVSDDMLGLAQQLDSELATSNLELVHNAVDWSLADTDLLAIRAHNAASRALTIDVDARGKWRAINLAIAALALVGLVAYAWLRRRAVKPLEVA